MAWARVRGGHGSSGSFSTGRTLTSAATGYCRALLGHSLVSVALCGRADDFDRVKLLVENGADVKGISISQHDCNQEIADYLVAKGAKRISHSRTADEFAAACYRADADRGP